MIPRYRDPVIDRIFSPLATYQRWLDVEVNVLQAQAYHGVIPSDNVAAILREAETLDWDAFYGNWSILSQIEQEESRTHHDVQAFVTVLAGILGPPADRWFHFGLTSSDVVDTALAVALRDATYRVITLANTLVDALAERISDPSPLQEARTHLQRALPISFADRATRWTVLVASARDELSRHHIPGKVSGPVGLFSPFLPQSVEADALTALGVPQCLAPSQVVHRSHHAALVRALASLVSACAQPATDLRLLASDAIREVSLSPENPGSSAMPHKSGLNPTPLEKICGLSNLVRHYAAAMEDASVIWLEHSMEHSCVERVVIPDAFHATCHALQTLTDQVTALTPLPGVSASTPDSYAALCNLILGGMTRQDAIRTLQQG